MSPIFGKKQPEPPNAIPCPFCSSQVPVDSNRYSHWESHLIAVTDNNGDRAYIYRCPQCGPSDLAYGAGKSEPQARRHAAYVVDVHVEQRHGLRV